MRPSALAPRRSRAARRDPVHADPRGRAASRRRPQPEQPKLAIREREGHAARRASRTSRRCRIVQIINGRRSESASVTWVFRWRVEIAKAGSLHVPAVTITQGSKHGDRVRRRHRRRRGADDRCDEARAPAAEPAGVRRRDARYQARVAVPREAAGPGRSRCRSLDSDAVTVTQPPVADPKRAIRVRHQRQEARGAVRRRCGRRRRSVDADHDPHVRRAARHRQGRDSRDDRDVANLALRPAPISSAARARGCSAPPARRTRSRSSRCPRPIGPRASRARSARSSRSARRRAARSSSSASRSSSRSR